MAVMSRGCKATGSYVKVNKFFLSAFTFTFFLFTFTFPCPADEVKEPNVAGTFYPALPFVLSGQIETFLAQAKPVPLPGEPFALIVPHAGYEFSGQVAAYGYKLVKDKPYKTVIILAPSHRYPLQGISVYPAGAFRTPLGQIRVDESFTRALMSQEPVLVFDRRAFAQEHALEVQLPFLQKTLKDFKIVPIILGECSLAQCEQLAQSLKKTIGARTDVLVVASSDMYHGYDYLEAPVVDTLTLSYIQTMDAAGLYRGLAEEKLQLCGGFGVVTTLLLAKSMKHTKAVVLRYTNSAEVTGQKTKGTWTVGYSSIAIDSPAPNTTQAQKEAAMLNKDQRRKLLILARKTIETYLSTRKAPEVKEDDPLLCKEMGAFVTLHEFGQLRGCIGNLVGTQALYLTVRDMAIEAATGDPRFSPVTIPELKNLEIEISVLSVPEKVDSAEKIEMGKHGVIVKKGFNSGVFLPQVATETGWSKEEFLSHLCAQKAGLPPHAWKDKGTELYTFTAEVFSEKEFEK